MEQNKKKKSRDAARQRRGQQNDEFSELASQLPVTEKMAKNLDRLCVMRLSNSYIKIKHVLQQVHASNKGFFGAEMDQFSGLIQDALGGFVFVLAEDGQCLYISPNVTESLGLQQLDVTGHSIYKYVHPCDQENLAKQLDGQVPLEDMEIFDGLFCADNSHALKNPKPAVNADLEKSPHRSFFLRMKSTLTSRGKSVNINASIYRVVQCTGTIQMYRTKLGSNEGSMTRCLLAIGNPLLSNATFEVPIDRQTFITKHTLDMKITEIENLASSITGYKSDVMINTSWYIYAHLCDSNVVKACHEEVLKKGQAVSGYYRVLVNTGGWIWMQTKANMVYSSTNGQPQYIVCMHSLVSGLELENEILGTEQMASTPCKNFRKRPAVEAEKEVLQAPMLKQPANNVVSTIKALPEEQLNLAEEELYLGDLDDQDMPGLDFLDVDDEFQDFTTLSSRSPYIPPPFIDNQLSSGNIDGDLASIIEESELLNRAPYIPPPCIDKILSFDDLSLPEEDEEQGNNSFLMDSASLISSATRANQIYDTGDVKIPMHLLARHIWSGKNQQSVQ